MLHQPRLASSILSTDDDQGMRLSPGIVMIVGLVQMAAVLGLGSWLSGRCQSNASPERPYRYESGPGLVIYCGRQAGPILNACPYLFAGGGLVFIIGALWLGWREGRNSDDQPPV